MSMFLGMLMTFPRCQVGREGEHTTSSNLVAEVGPFVKGGLLLLDGLVQGAFRGELIA